MQKLRQSAKSSFEPAVLPVSTASSFLPDATGPHRAFQGDEMDIGDVIWSQQEINRLSSEVSRLKAEVSHWKELVQVIFHFKQCLNQSIFLNQHSTVKILGSCMIFWVLHVFTLHLCITFCVYEC